MRNLRKFSVFALFLILFATVACSVFSAPFREMTANLFTGGGCASYFMPVEGANGNVYVLRAGQGAEYELYELNGSERQSRQTLRSGLPEDYEVQSLYISGSGDILLSLYTRAGVQLTEYGLYASVQGGQYQALLKAPLQGITSGQKRQSAGLSGVESDGETLLLTVLQSGSYTRYAFSPQQGQGLETLGTLDAAQAQSFGEQQRGLWTAAQLLAEQSGLDLDRMTALTPCADGSALVILDQQELYRLSDSGAVENLSAGLYGHRWQSGLCLLAALLVLLALSYGCYYFICETNKLYFPLAAKSLIFLALAGYIAVNIGIALGVAPQLKNEQRTEIQRILLQQAQTAAENPDGDLAQAAWRTAQLGSAYEDVELIRLALLEEGWTVEESSNAGETSAWTGTLSGCYPGEQNRAAQAVAGQSNAFTASYCGDPAYFVYAPAGQGELIGIRINASVFEQELERQIHLMRNLCLGAAGFIVVLAVLALAAAAKGAKRATRGIGLIAQGAAQVRVVQQSGDELEALAAAVNDLSAQEDARQKTGAFQSEAYLRFVPQRLVALLGVSDIKQVDKTTTASQEMAVMVVRFAIPQSPYQRGAQALFDDINEVFSYVARPVSAAGGAIYSFTYNGFDAVFENGIKTAAGAAVAVRQALLDLNTQREVRHLGAVKLRVALDYGEVLIGVVGDEDRVVPTIVSDSLDTACQLAALAPVLDANILCTALVADAAGEYALRYIGKCRQERRELRVYEIYDGDDFETRQAKESSRAVFSAGIYAFYSGEFSQAKEQFMEIARRPGEDGVALHYLYLADQYEKQPPEHVGLN